VNGAGGLHAGSPHLPYPAQIEAYGNGGFRFGGMSHRGSILCLPAGVWAWPVEAPQQIDDVALRLLTEASGSLDFILLGTGKDFWQPPAHVRLRFRDMGVSLDAMPTGPAVRTYNVMLAESRRVGAGLIAVD